MVIICCSLAELNVGWKGRVYLIPLRKVVLLAQLHCSFHNLTPYSGVVLSLKELGVLM